MISMRSNSSLFELSLLNEMNTMPVFSENRNNDYSNAYTNLVDPAHLSSSLEPLPIRMEPRVAVGYQPFQSECSQSVFMKEHNPSDPLNAVLGSLVQNYSNDTRANEALYRANTFGLPTTAPSSASHPSSPCGPNEHDVVCSRGKVFYNLPGNVRFRKTIRSCIPSYLAVSNKMDKSAIIDGIIDYSTNSGLARFLKYNSRTKTWTVLRHDQIRDKVGHALREAIYEMERERKVTSLPRKLTRW